MDLPVCVEPALHVQSGQSCSCPEAYPPSSPGAEPWRALQDADKRAEEQPVNQDFHDPGGTP